MKKIISMLLVLAMIITVLTVGIATTTAAETATITIYGLDGSTEVKEVNVGDEFTVYTTLNVSGSVSNGKVGSVQGTQTYTAGVLALQDQLTGQYGGFADNYKVFPILGDTVTSNAAQSGKILYNASMPSVGFKFDTDHSQLIVTTYKVTAAGTGEVKNAIRNLAAADEAITKIVFEGTVQEGKSIAGTATFEDPTPEIDHSHVTIHKLDGTTEEKDYQVGDTFTVYTMLNVSASVADGKVASINGAQKYTASKLALADEIYIDDFMFRSDVFPTTKTSTVSNCTTPGIIKYAASSPYGFLFNNDNCQLITTTYTVKENGFADIYNTLNVLAAADEDATRIVFGGETQSGMSYAMPASFYPPGEAPTEPPETQAPATEAPATEAPSTEVPSTETATLKVTIIGVDGAQTVQEFGVGTEFTVYTVLDATASTADGGIACINGSQTYPTEKLQLTDAVTGESNEVVDKTAMFPILGDSVITSAKNGTIKFNATKPGINNGFIFNSDKSKLIVTNYKVLAGGTATVQTTLKTLVADDSEITKIVWESETQSGMEYAMPASFTDPGAPEPPETEAPATEAPATEAPATEAPATEAPATEAPATEAPATEPPADQAVITIYDINGNSTEKTFSIGDTFTVYTSFDVSESIENGMISSIAASQSFSTDVLQTADDIDSIGIVQNASEMFPVFGTQATAKINTADGINKYNASTPYIGSGFVFNSEESLLIVTKYTVIAAGAGEVRNVITTCAAADAALTRLVSKGVIQDGVVLTNTTSFTDPTHTTHTAGEPVQENYVPATCQQAGGYDLVTYCTVCGEEISREHVDIDKLPHTIEFVAEVPATVDTEGVKAHYVCTVCGDKFWDEAGTQPASDADLVIPKLTPTEAPTATVTIYGFDGTSETKTYNVGDTFPVYTTLKTTQNIASISATQTFTSSVLTETDAVDELGIVTVDAADMFPVLGANAIARVVDGEVRYNASTGALGSEGYAFTDDNIVLIVTNYEVTAAGDAEIRNALTTVAAANDDLTRIVDKGVVADGETIEGIASFTEPEAPVAVIRYMLGDANNDDEVSVVDATWIQRYCAQMNLGKLDKAILERNGDVDDSEDIEVTDATFIQRYCAEMRVPYPVGEYIEIPA